MTMPSTVLWATVVLARQELIHDGKQAQSLSELGIQAPKK